MQTVPSCKVNGKGVQINIDMKESLYWFNYIFCQPDMWCAKIPEMFLHINTSRNYIFVQWVASHSVTCKCLYAAQLNS